MTRRYATWTFVLLVFLICGLAGSTFADKLSGQSIGPLQFRQLVDQHRGDPAVVLLDVRTPWEFKAGHIQGAVLLDYYSRDFVEGLKSLDREKTYLVYCRSGNRSGKSLAIFNRLGFRQAYHLDTGIRGWLKERYPVVQ